MLPSAAATCRQNRTGSLSAVSSDSQATGRPLRRAQSASNAVFPNPAGAHTTVSSPATASVSRSTSRGRGTRPCRARGMCSLVASSASSPAAPSSGAADTGASPMACTHPGREICLHADCRAPPPVQACRNRRASRFAPPDSSAISRLAPARRGRGVSGRAPTIAGSLPGWPAGAGELDAQRSLVRATQIGEPPCQPCLAGQKRPGYRHRPGRLVGCPGEHACIRNPGPILPRQAHGRRLACPPCR